MNKLKILHISHDFNYSCGVSKYINELSRYYSKKEIYNLYFITNKGNAINRLKDLGIKIKFIKFYKGFINIFFFMPNLLSVLLYCYKEKINIIHTHHRYPELLAIITGKILKIKTITTVHSILSGYRLLSFKSDQIIAVSNIVTSTLTKSYNIPKEKIIRIYNCINTLETNFKRDTNKFKRDLNISDNSQVILFLGRIIEEKGIRIIINSFKKISKVNFNAVLLIIGDHLDRSLDSVINNLQENVKVMPAIKNPYALYSFCEMVVLPSKIESFPYVMLESGLMKKPFIGSRTGGMAEFIEDGVNGLLFEPGNVDQLAEKIKYVLDNPDKSKLLGENLHKKVIAECSCDNYFRKLDEIYDELSR